MSPKRLAGTGSMVLDTPDQLDNNMVSQLRAHGRLGGAVSIAVPGVEPVAAMRSSMVLTAAARDCGCQTGSRFAAAVLLTALLVVRLNPHDLAPHGLRAVFATVGATLIASVAGKTIGIGRARRRLRRELRTRRVELSQRAPVRAA